MAPRHVVAIHAVATADTTALRRSLSGTAAEVKRDLESTLGSITSKASKASVAQGKLGAFESDYRAAFDQAEKTGSIDPKELAQLRQAFDSFLGKFRGLIADSAGLTKINPATERQLAAGTRRVDDFTNRSAQSAADAAALRQAKAVTASAQVTERITADKVRQAQAPTPAVTPVPLPRRLPTLDQAVRTFAQKNADDIAAETERQSSVTPVALPTRRRAQDESATADAANAAATRADTAATQRSTAATDNATRADNENAASTRAGGRGRGGNGGGGRGRTGTGGPDDEDFNRLFGAPGPGRDQLLAFQRGMTPTNPDDPNSAPLVARAKDQGMSEALKRFWGLMLGYNQALTEAEEPFSQHLAALRGSVTALRAYQATIEDISAEEKLYAELTQGGERDLYKATAALAEVRERTALVERSARREGTADLVPEQGANRAEDQLRRADIEREKIRALRASSGGVDNLAGLNAERAQLEALIKANAAALARDTDSLDATARAREEQRITRSRQNQAQQDIFRQQGGYQQGTFFQRAQARVAERQGQAPRSPLEYQTGRQFLTSKALTTGGFALSGGLLYGAINLGGDVLRQSTELQQQLALIRTQFAETSQAANGISFDKYRRELAATSVDTGVAADEVANVQRQLAGAFANENGDLNFARASTEGQTALRYSKISSLPQQEITDSLTAVALAFRDANNEPLPFEDILDTITGLENRFGVLGPEILKFTADLAPLGKELGFTAEQLAGLGAVAQKASGKSGDVLAEQLGRILPQMKEKSAELFDLFNQNGATAGDAPELLTAFASGDSARALELLIKNYDRLDKSQKNSLANIVGGSRQAATFYALLGNSADSLRVLNPSEAVDDSGKFDARWQTYKETVTANLEQMRRAVEEFGQVLFESGLSDGLTTAAVAGKLLFGVLTLLVSAVGEINGAMGGLPAKAAALLLIAKAFTAIRAAAGGKLGLDIATAGGTAAVGRGAGGRFAGVLPFLQQPGGRFSPYSAPIARRDSEGRITGSYLPGYGPDGALPNNGLRPSTVAASNTRVLQRGLTRQNGQIVAGIGTGLTSALAAAAPIIAGALVFKLMEDIDALQAQMAEAREKVRTQVAEQLEKGVSADEIRKRADVGGKDPSSRRTLQLLTLPLGGVGGFLAPKVDDYLDLNVDDQVADVIDEEEARYNSEVSAQVADLLAERFEKRGADISDALASDKVSGGAKDVLRDLLKNKSKQKRGPSRRGRAAPSTDETLTAADFTELAQKIRDDPTNKELQEALTALIEAGGLPPDALAAADALMKELAEGKVRSNDLTAAAAAVEANQTSQQDFVTQLSELRNSYATGGGATLNDITSAIRKKRELALSALKSLEADNLQGSVEYANQSKIVQDLNKELIDNTVIADAEATRTIADDVADRSGADPLAVARAKTGNAREAFKKIRAAREATVVQKAAAARAVLDAQAEEYDAALAAAVTDEDFAALLRDGIQRDPEARKFVIAEGLSTGRGAEVVQQFADVLDLSIGETRALITKAIMDANGFNDKIDVVAARKRAEQLRAATSALGSNQRIGTDTSLSALEGSGLNELSAIEDALRTLPGLNLTEFDPGASETGTAADRLSAEQSRLSAQANVARANAGNDAVAAAKAAADEARAQLEAVKRATPNDQAAINNAMANVTSTENALANAVRSRAQALRQSAFDLQRAGAYGNASALANIDAAAARSLIANAEAGPAGDQDRAQGEVALANAFNASRQAAIAQQAARGEYLATLLAGDSEGQARQQLANAQQALASSTADNRYSAMQAVVEAQRALQSAIVDNITSQIDVAIAVAEGGGETVKVAFLQLQQAQARFDAAKAAGLQGAQLNAAKADLQRAQDNAVNVARNDRISDLDYLLEFDKISAGEYIKMLKQELERIPETNKPLRQEIDRKIKAVRDAMSQNSSLNLPDNIDLPTRYEAKRLGQFGTFDGAGPVQNNDNRQINVEINESGDPRETFRQLAEVLNSSPRTGQSATGVFV